MRPFFFNEAITNRWTFEESLKINQSQSWLNDKNIIHFLQTLLQTINILVPYVIQLKNHLNNFSDTIKIMT